MSRVFRLPLLLLALIVASTLSSAGIASARPAPGTYRNPIAPRIAKGGTVDSCADPTVFRGRRAHARSWYMFCTSDPLNDSESSAATPVLHPVPMMRTSDLRHWRYVGDALPHKPSWAGPKALLWAPDVVYSRTYHR